MTERPGWPWDSSGVTVVPGLHKTPDRVYVVWVQHPWSDGSASTRTFELTGGTGQITWRGGEDQ